jgi:hypothetical protein
MRIPQSVFTNASVTISLSHLTKGLSTLIFPDFSKNCYLQSVELTKGRGGPRQSFENLVIPCYSPFSKKNWRILWPNPSFHYKCSLFPAFPNFFFKENNETALSSLALQQRHLAEKRFKYD